MKPMGAASSTLQCEAHKQHYPTPTYTELHHVIPQAWQAHWQPSTPPFPGPSPDRPGLILWDSRTVALCRTGHGNVHYWLVQIMHELDALAHYSKLDPDLPATWAKAIGKIRGEARATHRHIVAVDIGYASNALTRYDAAGGKVSDLIANKLWGEI